MKIILSVILTLVFIFNLFSATPLSSVLGFIKSDRNIAGTVTDKNGKFIECLKVSAINDATKKQYKTRTNKSGFYTLADLPLGTYTIKFGGNRGFLPKTIEKVEIGLNGGLIYNTSLELK